MALIIEDAGEGAKALAGNELVAKKEQEEV